MRPLAVALLASVLAVPCAAQAACPPGQVYWLSDGKGKGGCGPCTAGDYVAGGRCKTCPTGYTSNKQRTGCVKAADPWKCPAGQVYWQTGGMGKDGCGPCNAGDYVAGG